ncbi:MAG: uncharacterized protein JWP91_137 [Fibrobacteres bacterium]|nr:uncharacterized protein [Fibrobacterota bacterium]
MPQDNYRLNAKLGGGPVFLGVGVVGAAICAFSFMQNRQEFFASYLTAFSFFLAIALGSFFFVFVQHLARSAWSVTIRRVSETAAANLPWMLLLFIPVILGAKDILPWLNPEMRANDHLVHLKEGYLNPTFLWIRVGLIFGVWTLFSLYFLRTSRKQDETGNPALTTSMGKVAAGAAILFTLSQTVFALDWIMSLDPHWFSTMFGVYYFAGAVVAQYCFLILVSAILRNKTGRKDIFRTDHFHDAGKLLFGHNVFWTYIGFSQFFLIWYANIPEETMFFQHRAASSWKVISLMLPWCHFAIPFLYLMSWHVKRNIVALSIGCVWLLTMCYIDIYWLIQPNFHHEGAHFGLGDVGSILAVGGFFLFLFIRRLNQANLIPSGDPRLADCLSYDNGVITNEHD